jgi:primosomal protein N' (replication factor Y) (superfamily II helicase)
MSVLRLAIPSPLRRQFDYLPPIGMNVEDIVALRPGVRLRVPFGGREVTGFLLAVCKESAIPLSSLKPALEVLDQSPLIDPQMLQLCHWAADYYHHPLGDVYSNLFPRRLREGKPHASHDARGWQLTVRGKGLPDGALPRSPRQAQALSMLQHTPVIENSEFRINGINGAILHSLQAKGLIETCNVSKHQQTVITNQNLILNPEQAASLATLIGAAEGFSCHLLEGVTGSGKTEIYLQLIDDCLQRGRQALVLVPEIGLTPQTLARFQQRFTAHIAVLHSGRSDAQRYSAWEAARTGAANIVIGTRSAIFTPLAKPGLIIVDEEHDSSYKQQDGFRYSARDVAVKRAQIHACPILLGSATPSLESIHNVLAGRYQHHQLTRRAGSGGMPDIKVLDVRRQALQAGLSDALITAVDDNRPCNVTIAAGSLNVMPVTRD